MALNFSRFLVEPVRILTITASWLMTAGGLVWTSLLALLYPLTFLIPLLNLVLPNITQSIMHIYGLVMGGGAAVLVVAIFLTVPFLMIWAVAGYVMGALTLGHWGGFVSQLLLNFRITVTPEGATADTKVYSPLRWRSTLLHSLTYADGRALEDISQWIALRMSNGAGNAPQSCRSV